MPDTLRRRTIPPRRIPPSHPFTPKPLLPRQRRRAKSRADVETLCRQSSPIPKDAAAPVEGGKVLTEKRAKDDSSRRHVVEPVLPVGYTADGSGTGVYEDDGGGSNVLWYSLVLSIVKFIIKHLQI